MNKKISNTIIIFLLLILILLIIRYIRKESVSSVASQEIQTSFKVYLITIDKTDQFWHEMDEGAYDMAELLGLTYIWDAPEVKDNEKQIEILNKAVEDGANLIMLAANDPAAISNAIENAKERNVQIIYVDSPANEEAIVTVATNNYFAGITAGETMLGDLEEAGISSGSIGIIGVNETTNSTIQREIGFREVIEQDGRFQLLPTVFGNGDPIASQELAYSMFQEHQELVGLFGTNEGSTEGVGNAIMANRNVIGIGFDRSDEILALVRGGYLDAVLVQNPYTMGYLGMAEAYAALIGKDTGPPFINTGVSILRKRF